MDRFYLIYEVRLLVKGENYFAVNMAIQNESNYIGFVARFQSGPILLAVYEMNSNAVDIITLKRGF